MDSREFTEWLAYYRIDPYGNERGDIQAGIVAAASVNLWSKTRRNPSDYMPKFGEAREQTIDEAKHILGIPSGNHDS